MSAANAGCSGSGTPHATTRVGAGSAATHTAGRAPENWRQSHTACTLHGLQCSIPVAAHAAQLFPHTPAYHAPGSGGMADVLGPGPPMLKLLICRKPHSTYPAHAPLLGAPASAVGAALLAPWLPAPLGAACAPCCCCCCCCRMCVARSAVIATAFATSTKMSFVRAACS